MSSDAGYMLIRVNLQGARTAAAEAAVLRGEIAGTGSAATAAGTAAQSSARKTGRLQSAWTGVARAAKLGALGLVGAGAGLALMAKEGIAQTKELGLAAAGLRRNLGMSAEEGSRWAALTKARGIDMKSFVMSMTTYSRTLAAAAKGDESYLETLKMIGLDQKFAKAGTKDFQGAIVGLAEAFGEAEGGAERQAAAQKMLGRGYQTVLPMFAGGSDELERMLHWADKYNLVMGDEMVDKTIHLAQAERQSTMAWMGMKQALSTSLIPTVIDAHREFQEFAAAISDPKLSRDQKLDLITEKMEEVADKGAKFLADMIPKVASRVGETAPRVAAAFFRGFVEANIWGKLVLGYWLASKLVAGSLIVKVAGAAGVLGKKFGTKFVQSAVLWLMGTSVGSSLLGFFMPAGKFSTKFSRVARMAGSRSGKVLGRAFVGGVAAGILLYGDEIADAWDEIMPGDWSGGLLRGEGGGLGGDPIPGLDEVKSLLGFASGGTTPWSGTFLVGERGPELVSLPGGARITPNHQLPGGASPAIPARVGMGEYQTAMLAPDDPHGTALTVPRERDQVIVLELDGKEVARTVLKHGQDARARK